MKIAELMMVQEAAAPLQPGQKFIQGIPGEIISTAGSYVLIYFEDDYGDVRKNEYDIYRYKNGEFKRENNLNMPYRRPAEAIERFQAIYGSEEA